MDVWSDVESRVIEAPFGVDIKRFSPAGEKARALSTRFLFVGAMDRAHPFKGVDVLFRACAMLPQDGWSLVGVGDGDSRAQYERDARARGLSGRVTFLGRVSDDELSQVYREADVCVVPSTSRAEAFGLVALEAQSSGVPVIASRLDGVQTVIENGKTGWLVAPSDAKQLFETMQWCMKNPDAVQQAGIASRRRMEQHYAWDAHIDTLINNYRELL